MEWKQKLPEMLAAIREAGHIMRAAHDVRREADSVAVKPGDANFVTVYDGKVQNFLLERLGSLLPGAAFMAEEKENRWEELSHGLCFVIDPIDGTTNFIHDYGCSTVSVALFEGGKAVFGAVYNPYVDELFTACRGEGTFCNGRRVSVSDVPPQQALVLLGTSPYYKSRLAAPTFAMAQQIFLTVADVRRSGSAAWDFCSVACGRAEGFVELLLSPWDYAAGCLLVQEAGGVVTQADGTPLSPVAGCSVVAGNPAVQRVLAGIAGEFTR